MRYVLVIEKGLKYKLDHINILRSVLAERNVHPHILFTVTFNLK